MILKEILGNEHENFIREQLKARRLNNIFGGKILSQTDINVCDYVVDNLPRINIDKVQFGSVLEKTEFIDICLKDISVLGQDIYSKVENNLSSIPIEEIPDRDVLQLDTGVSYEIQDDKLKEDSGIVTKFCVPSKLHEITAYFFGHEQLHALKDINFQEYQNLKQLGEVIPIFYEFLIYNPSELMKKEVIKERITYIYDAALEYRICRESIEENDLDASLYGSDYTYHRKKNAYEYARTCPGNYINSFYYAMILYKMYLETPQKILNLVSKVLRHEMTTLEMLEQLGIYGYIQGEIFEKEFANIKKLIR